MALIPAPLFGGKKLETLAKAAIRSRDELERWLNQRQIETTSWGVQEGSKSPDWLFKEIKGDEAGLELWKTALGDVRPVRVTHVLRAKVTSPESYRRNVFLFNTWQQFGKDGKIRVRNGLLAEKLTLAEMPFDSNMLEICLRAVTEEEMQRVVDSTFRVHKDGPVEFDASYECPIKVVDVHLVDHTIEVEESQSFPGLLTLYHLYTCDIVCTNLPVVDFNTLEFAHRDESGNRKLKYVHAWVWLRWPQIKRYLFEGSELKERKTKGSFEDPSSLQMWLSQFNLDLEEWGQGRYRDVRSLFAELENESAHLELWGRQDGVPLVMRVLHVLQVRLQSSDYRLGGKFLVSKWSQNENLQVSYVERPFAKKLKASQSMTDIEGLAEQAKSAVKEELAYITDSFFEFEEEFVLEELDKSDVEPQHVEYIRHWYDLEESPSFKGMFTMYHMYAFDMQCHNLPQSSFTSVHRSGDGSLTRTCWQWSTWEETASAMNSRHAKLTRQEAQHVSQLDGSADTLSSLAAAVQTLIAKASEAAGAAEVAEASEAEAPEESAMTRISECTAILQQEMNKMRETSDGGDQLARMFPPSMISKLAGQSIAPESLIQQTVRSHFTEHQD